MHVCNVFHGSYSMEAYIVIFDKHYLCNVIVAYTIYTISVICVIDGTKCSLFWWFNEMF